jgi:hypothetical protein
MRFLFKRSAILIMALGVIYFCLFNHTPQGTECESSKSPDGLYAAQRCLLDWIPGGNSEYVGRLFDAKTGSLLAERTFDTPVPQLSWSSGVYYYPNSNSLVTNFINPSVSFSIGGGRSTYISIPPSKWDRLLAARPRL